MSQNLILPGQLTATTLTNSLSGDVALNNTGTFFDGPSVAQGTTGTWLACGTVSLVESGAAHFDCKLWDGTTLICSARHTTTVSGDLITVCLTGVITNPAGNIRISVRDASATTGFIKFNASGLSKDSTITVVRIGA